MRWFGALVVLLAIVLVGTTRTEQRSSEASGDVFDVVNNDIVLNDWANVTAVALVGGVGVFPDEIGVAEPRVYPPFVTCGQPQTIVPGIVGAFPPYFRLSFSLRTPSSFPNTNPAHFNQTYVTGPGNLNPDGMIHAKLEKIKLINEPPFLRISWEDLKWLHGGTPPSPDNPAPNDSDGSYNWDDCVVDVTIQRADWHLLDMGVPASLVLPWCAGDRENWLVVGDWDAHKVDGSTPGFAIDLQGTYPQVGTTLIAPTDGHALYKQQSGGYGNYVEIDLRNGWLVRMAHMQDSGPYASRFTSRTSMNVSRGEAIGNVGRTGRADGPHVHFELLPAFAFDKTAFINTIVASSIFGRPTNDFRYIGKQRTLKGTWNCAGTNKPSVITQRAYPMQTGDTRSDSFALSGDHDQSLYGEVSRIASDVDLEFIGPNGPATPDSYVKTNNYVALRIDSAPPGTWTYAIHANSLDPGGEVLNLKIVAGNDFAGDITPPHTTLSLSGTGQNGWFRSDVGVTLTATDDSDDPITTFYSLDGASFVQYAGPFQMSNEGRHPLSFYSVDTSENVEPTQTASILIDKTPPSTLASLVPSVPNGKRGWYISDVTVSLAASDPLLADGTAGSGVAATSYQVNGGGWQAYAGSFVVSTESLDNVVEFFSTDVAGNAEATKNVHFKLDKTPPDISITSGGLDELLWDQAHLRHGVLTNTGTLALTGNATDNLCLWEVRTVDVDSGLTTASQQPPDANVFPPPPPTSLGYSLSVPLHTGINTLDVTAEDCAGWTKAIRIQVVYVIPGPFDPRSKGFWYNAIKTKQYSTSQMQTFVDYTNVASDVWGTDASRNRYGELTVSRVRDLLNVSDTNPDMEPKMEAQLLADWLNMVSGRLAVKKAINVSSVSGWPTVMDDIGGNPLTFAYKVALEIEEKVQPAKASFEINTVAKNLAEGMNLKTIILP